MGVNAHGDLPFAMTTRPCVVQLFNAGGGAPAATGPDDYNPARDTAAMLSAEGFDVQTMPAYGFPFNPGARMHNAYLGLDPLRVLRVLLTRRRAALVCAHMESAVLLLLLRRIFRFRPPIIVWEVPFSPGWNYRTRIGRLALKRADCAVVFSTSQIAEMRACYGATCPAASSRSPWT